MDVKLQKLNSKKIKYHYKLLSRYFSKDSLQMANGYMKTFNITSYQLFIN